MKAAPLPNPQVLLSLAQEIQRSIEWLEQHQGKQAAQETRQRLNTLREAASMAGLRSVESALGKLGQENVQPTGSKTPETGRVLGAVLARLSSVIAEVAVSAGQKELEWVELINQLEEAHTSGLRGLQQQANRWDELGHLVRRQGLATDSATRAQLLAQIEERLQAGADGHGELGQTMARASSLLSRTSRQLLRELSGWGNVPLHSVLVRVGQRLTELSSAASRAASFHVETPKITIAQRQSDGLQPALFSIAEELFPQLAAHPSERPGGQGQPALQWTVQAERSRGYLEVEIRADALGPGPGLGFSRRCRQNLERTRGQLLGRGLDSPRWSVVLKLPDLPTVLEVLPVRTPQGDWLVPLQAIAGLSGASAKPGVEFPPLTTLWNPAEPAVPDSADIRLQLGSWKASLRARILDVHVRVSPMPAEAADPGWIVGRAAWQGRVLPIFHPLTFLEPDENETMLLH